MRKPFQSPGRMKNSSYYIAPVGVRTHDLPHSAPSNVVKVSHALRVSWTEHRTDDSILTELGTTRQLLGFVVRRKLSFFGHTIRDGGCELVKCVIQGKVSGKRRRGRPKTSYSSNITKWTSVSTERITRETRDRAGWRRLIRCAARAADHHSCWDRERRSSTYAVTKNQVFFFFLVPTQTLKLVII